MSRILIIENERELAEFEKRCLSIAGFDVLMENRGDRGLTSAIRGEIDMVILSTTLPGLGGLNVCGEIRSAKEIPIILVSDKKDVKYKIMGFNYGADDYITRPFIPAEFIARVKLHLSRYERLTSLKGSDKRKIVSIRDLTVNLTARSVSIDGRESCLTGKEYDILLYMIRNSNKVLRKKEIYEKVWGINAEQKIPTVTVHVGRLREKIEKDPDNPKFIETVWGIGYIFRGLDEHV